MPGSIPEFQKRLQSIERVLGTIEAVADPNVRSTARELVQLIMNLHGAGLERMLELIQAVGAEGAGIVERLGRDELVGNLLVLYGLHPMDFEARVNHALDKVRSRLRAHEGEVELMGIEEGTVRLRLHANGHGCGSNPDALKEMVEQAVYEGAPDVVTLVVEGADGKQGFVPLAMLQGSLTAGAKGAL